MVKDYDVVVLPSISGAVSGDYTKYMCGNNESTFKNMAAGDEMSR